jgi:hypothetical protein
MRMLAIVWEGDNWCIGCLLVGRHNAGVIGSIIVQIVSDIKEEQPLTLVSPDILLMQL